MSKLSLTYREQLPPIVADELDQLLTRLNGLLTTSDTTVAVDVASLQAQISSLTSSVAGLTSGVELLAHKGAASGYAGLNGLGLVAVTTGGTGISSYAVGDLLYASTTTILSRLADVAAGSFLRSGGVATAPAWSATIWTNSATTGDVLYASAANTYSNLASVAAGSFLRSGGVATVPAWSTTTWPNAATQGDLIYANAANAFVVLAKDTNATRYLSNTGASNNPAWAQVALTTGVSGVLPIANGGTNSSTALSGSTIMISNSTQIVQGAAGTTTTVLHGNAAGAPTYAAVSLTADVSGILPVGNGGTGTSTAFTLGSVVFAGVSGVYAEDNANFFWDDSANRLGIGTSGPSAQLHTTSTVRFANFTTGFARFDANGNISSQAASSAYTPTNVTTDRSYDADTVVITELADVVGTIIADLQAAGIFG